MSDPVMSAPSVAHVAEITALTVYPVKSFRGVSFRHIEVTPRGLARDRRWMVVDSQGKFLTQRTHPGMSLVHTRLFADHIDLTHEAHGTCSIPIELQSGPRREIEVWRHRGPAVEHAESRVWITSVMGQDAALVFMPDDIEREVNPAYGKPGDIVSFADAYPVLLTSEGSLTDLNSRLDIPLPMARFRPNVVINATQPFAEDQWPQITLGDISFRNVKPCDRCTMTTVEIDTGIKGIEPLRTLATYRKRDGNVYFGVNLVPDATGVIRVGDRVRTISAFVPSTVVR